MGESAPAPRYQLLVDHLGTGITLSYLALVAIGMFHNVVVELTNGTRDGGTPRRPLVMIGATSRYFIFFRTADWRTEVMPTGNVLRILPDGSLPSASVSRRERSWQRLDARPLPRSGSDSMLRR